MAESGVYDRWYRTVDGKRVASAEHGQGKRWQARWRDESGRQRKQNHDRRGRWPWLGQTFSAGSTSTRPPAK
jgi:hypothetical protein